jgi:hypothetical protein
LDIDSCKAGGLPIFRSCPDPLPSRYARKNSCRAMTATIPMIKPDNSITGANAHHFERIGQ